jgi:hypothetical protein
MTPWSLQQRTFPSGRRYIESMKTGQTSSDPFPVTRSHLGRGDDDSLNRGSGAEIGLVALLRLHDVPRVLRHGGTTRLVPIMAEEKPDGAGARVFRDPRPGVEHERALPFPGLERLQRDFQLVRWHDPRVQQSGVPPRDRDGPVAVRAGSNREALTSDRTASSGVGAFGMMGWMWPRWCSGATECAARNP